MEGNLLHSININSIVNIEDICIINNNYLIGYTKYDLFKIIIKDDQLYIKVINNNREGETAHDTFDFPIFPYQNILDVIYSAKNELLIISYNFHIEIRDINSLNENPIQKINIKYSFLLNMNKDLFIAFNKKSISLYKSSQNRSLNFLYSFKERVSRVLPTFIQYPTISPQILYAARKGLPFLAR